MRKKKGRRGNAIAAGGAGAESVGHGRKGAELPACWLCAWEKKIGRRESGG